ncbi:MAG: RnfABCDGE type electron transport complex subunit B [Spirochaetota bacterium]|nr:RnfABCDGE type electron transport complex subunit B [Spirochaetota bacterium]
MLIFWTVICVGFLSLIFGLGLALAHKKLAVEKNPLIGLIEGVLPQANCGACGQPGCSGYAVALVSENVEINLCTPGGAKLSKKLASILGKEATEGAERIVARIHCGGNSKTAKQKYVYSGITDCNQAVSMFGGSKECPFGCVGLGSCVRACAFDAIDITSDLEVIVNEAKCTGCGLCVPACPKNIIKMIPAKTRIFNNCSSYDKGGAVKKYCNVGCTACKLCEKACEYDAIHVKDNLAIYDYDKCTECNDCAVVCPTESIRSWIPEEMFSERSRFALAEYAKNKDNKSISEAESEKEEVEV